MASQLLLKQQQYMKGAMHYLHEAFKDSKIFTVSTVAMLSSKKDGTYSEFITVMYSSESQPGVIKKRLVFCTALSPTDCCVYFYYAYNLFIEKGKIPIQKDLSLNEPFSKLKEYIQRLTKT